MLRSVTYRKAGNVFVFTALWFVFGAVALWSPLPGALGISGAMFGAWVLLFFAALALSGAMLMLAAINAAFPRRPRYVRRNTALPTREAGEPVWAPRREAARTAGSARRDG